MVPRGPPRQSPAAEATARYCTLYHRDTGFAALAEAELRARGDGYSPEPGLWLSPRPIRWAACGYGRAGGQELAFAATLDELAEQLRALRIVAPRFCIETRTIPRRRKGSTAARRRLADCIDGDVSVKEPQLRLLLIVSPLGHRLLVDAEVEPGEADWLAVGHKPHNSMVALPVRIAKAMLNLTARAGDTVLDPFCGSGTIPLLAAWAGHETFASDISFACVARTRRNLAHFGQRATVVRADARNLQQTADCIVSNLPYGVYCHLGPEGLRESLVNLTRSPGGDGRCNG
jgi:hypothetical protein